MLLALRTKIFYEHIYRQMVEKQVDTLEDSCGVVWHSQEVKEILIHDYGYRPVSGGGLI